MQQQPIAVLCQRLLAEAAEELNVGGGQIPFSQVLVPNPSTGRVYLSRSCDDGCIGFMMLV